MISSELCRPRRSPALVWALAPRQDRRLREQALGRLEGVGNVAARAAVADVDWSDPDVAIGGGESAREVFDRMADLLGPITGMNAIVVSHGDAIRYALGWLAGHHAADCPWHEVGPGAVFAVGVGGPARRLG